MNESVCGVNKSLRREREFSKETRVCRVDESLLRERESSQSEREFAKRTRELSW